MPLLERAIARTTNAPSWYYQMIAVDLLLKEDYRAMRDVAERSARSGSPFSQALIAIPSARLGDRDATRLALARMSASEVLAENPALLVQRNGASDRISEALLDGLADAKRLAASP